MRRAEAVKAATPLSLGVVLALTLISLSMGLLTKRPCALRWGEMRRLCYSDVIVLYEKEYLSGDRLPYLDPCPAAAGPYCDEYPVLTMYVMRVAAWGSSSSGEFFYVNAALIAVAALVTSWCLYLIGGSKALYWALAPTMVIYAFINWDVLAVMFSTASLLAFLRRRDRLAGALLGLGAAAKFYPLLLLVPFIATQLREHRRDRMKPLLVGAGTTFVLANLPFALAAPEGWARFFRFNADRPADWDSLWYILCRQPEGGVPCPWSAELVNVGALGLFVVLSALVWLARRARQPDFPRWTLAFPVYVVFLLTTKVYSPQFGLWLLPLFALAFPHFGLFAAFTVADIAVFITRFLWLGRVGAQLGLAEFAGFEGVSLASFQAALLGRAAVLCACLIVWVRQPTARTEISRTGHSPL